jgi:radical SAM protein with 4Fe4S-binding SPASM domain
MDEHLLSPSSHSYQPQALPPGVQHGEPSLVVRLTPRPEQSPASLAGGYLSDTQCDCDCDCACPVGSESFAFTLSRPCTAYIELTPACNNRCPGCSNVFASRRSLRPLDAAQWERILVKLRPHVHRLKITGGEPTLHPQFEAIVGRIAAMGIPFVLFTNARWRDPTRLVGFLHEVPQCRGLLISLHGAAAASHEAFTGIPGSFEETLANIRQAVAAGLSVTTSTVITRHNWTEIVDITHLSHDLGVHHAVFNRYLGLPLPEIEPSLSQLYAAIRAVELLGQHPAPSNQHPAKFGNCIPQCFARSSSTGCLAGIAYCTVDPWGNVRPCNHAPLIVGNLLEQSVREVWYSDGMQRWRDMIAPQCRSCVELPRCHGGCRAVAMIRGVEKDPLIRGPIHDKAPSPLVELTLYEGAYPVAHFTSRAESFGLALTRDNRVIPVASRAKPILDACDGSITLCQVHQRFGQEALNLVGFLYQEGLMSLLPLDSEQHSESSHASAIPRELV